MNGQLIYNDRTFNLKDLTVIGSDSQCGAQISSPQVADRHARIEKNQTQYIVRDLRSPTGTFVNGTQILEAVLNDGDLIEVGDETLLFSLSSSSPSEAFPMSSKNPVWNEELQQLANVSKTHHPVLILGPSGTGKDVVAQNLHEQSLRHQGPFVCVNCSALTETLIESELFGHIKGSFTGAINDRKGAFEAARGGTLFLDEIGDLSAGLQAKLLRALENNEIRPVGSDRTVKTDVRIVAATHQNIYEKIQDKSFRSDLYFRLNVVCVKPPALEHRMEDFDDLFYIFAKKQRVRFSFAAIARLKKHSWPGNIRELKNLVTRASAMYPKTLIEEFHAEKLIDKTLIPAQQRADVSDSQLPVIKEIEKQMILKRLHANRGNQRRTASDLGMPKSTLHDRLKYYQIDPDSFKFND